MGDCKKCYGKDFAKSIYVLVAFLIATLTLTAFVASYEFGFFRTIYFVQHVLDFLIIAFAVVGVITLIYLLASLKARKITFADSAYLGLVLIGMFFFAYVCLAPITGGKFNLRRILFTAIPFGLGLILLVVRAIVYAKLSEKATKQTNNKMKNYYKEIFGKFSFIGILIASGVAFSFVYLVINSSNEKRYQDLPFLIALGVTLLPLIVYSVKSLFDKKVNMLDALLLTGIVTFPLSLIYIITSFFNETKTIIWAITFAVYIVATFIRYIRYDNKYVAPEKKASRNYFKAVLAKTDVLGGLAVGGLIASAVIFLLCTSSIHAHIYTNATFELGLKSIPVAILLIAIFGSLLFFGFTTLCSIKRVNIGKADFFLSILTGFVLFSLIGLYAYYPSQLFPAVHTGALIIVTFLIVARSVNYSKIK
jgi:hypothetical protein